MWVSERLRGGAYSETDTDSVAPGKVPEGGKAISWKSFEVSQWVRHPSGKDRVSRPEASFAWCAAGSRSGLIVP